MSDITRYLLDGFEGDLTTLKTLQLLCGFNNLEAAEFCLVSLETYRRWRTDRRPNPTAVRLLAVRAGHIPWPGWHGWEMHNGFLFPPGYRRSGISAGDMFAIPYLRELVGDQQRELIHLRQSYQSVGG